MTKLYDIMDHREHEGSFAELLIDPTKKALIYIISDEDKWRRWEEKEQLGSYANNRMIAANLSKREGGKDVVRLRSYIGDPSFNQHYVISEETKSVRAGFLRLQRKSIITLRMQQVVGDIDFPWFDVDKFMCNVYVCRATVDDVVEEVREAIAAYNRRDSL